MPIRPAAPKTAFVCQQCGNDFPKWVGRCPGCGGWNTLVEERVVAPQKGRSGPARVPREPVADASCVVTRSGGGETSLMRGGLEIECVVGEHSGALEVARDARA